MRATRAHKPTTTHVLFMLALAMHEKAPKMFAIDSFDHAMNPRLARKVTEIFSQKIIEENNYHISKKFV